MPTGIQSVFMNNKYFYSRVIARSMLEVLNYKVGVFPKFEGQL